jgi:C-terminal processing protease CtpA/Prc
MIRAVLTDKAPKDAKTTEVALDDGEKIGAESLGGSGHVIEFGKPSGTWWLRSVRLYGQRYGGDTAFTVTLATKSMKPLHAETARYTLFPHGEFAWVDVPVTAALKVPSRFRVVVDFDPGPTKGVHIGYTKAKRPRSYTGLPGVPVEKFTKGDWMIRVVLTKEKPSLPEAKPPPARDASVYMKDFEFLAKTVKRRFPAFEKKGVDWDAVVAEWRPRFKSCRDDKTHVLNARRLIALLNDAHSLVRTKVEVHVPTWDGLCNAGLWIAVERGRLVLRAIMDGHALSSRLTPGAELIEIDGRPAKIVHEEVRRKARVWSGWSSIHFLDARLSWQFFPHGDRARLSARFLNPDGKVVAVEVPQWGPGGRPLSRRDVTMPEGLPRDGRAVSKMLDGKVGYIRILGSMDQSTRAEFFTAFDALKGAKAIVLDCRGMGGGSDRPAWAMAGRFYEKPTNLGTSGTLMPSGGWQFGGPVVMLQDEREISSAESFTWAMTETGRVVSVGRPTAGGTIIPTSFPAPSGLFDLQLGVTDRRTPIEGIQPEGHGTPPDIFVPYEPFLLRRHADPTLAVGLEVLTKLMDGAKKDDVVASYPGALLARRGVRDAFVAWERRICETKENLMPDFAGASERLRELGAKVPKSWAREIEAQKAYEAMVAAAFPPPEEARKAFLGKHGRTRYGAAVRKGFE